MSDQEKNRDGETKEFGGAHIGKETSPIRDEERGDGFDGWWEERNLPQKIVLGIGFGVLGIGLLFLFGLVVMVLWNWLMPEIFGLKRLNYWQAWGLLALSCILLGRIGGNGSGDSSDRKRKRKLRRYIKEEMERDAMKKAETPRP